MKRVESVYFLHPPPPFEWSARFRYRGQKEPGFHSHNSFQFAGALRGRFFFDFPDGSTWELREGEALLMAPDTPHVWRSPEGEDSEVVTLLCGACEKEKFGEIGEVLVPWAAGSRWRLDFKKAALEDFSRGVMNVSSGGSPVRRSVILARHLLFMAEICGRVLLNYGPPERRDGMPEPVMRALRHIGESYMSQISLGDLSRRAGLSQSRFSEIFSARMGKAPVQYLNDFRVKKAETLLLHGSLSMEEVAARTGFSSMHYFCRMFKKRNGIPPAAFRKKFRQ